MHGLASLEDYQKLLRADKLEIEALFPDLLISVMGSFGTRRYLTASVRRAFRSRLGIILQMNRSVFGLRVALAAKRAFLMPYVCMDIWEPESLAERSGSSPMISPTRKCK